MAVLWHSAMGRWARALLLLMAAYCLAAPGSAWSQNEAPEYAYKVTFSGLNGTGLEEVLKGHSDLVRLRKEAPGSIWTLRGRIRKDLKTFATILRSEGYYGARLSYDLQRRKQPIVVDILVEPGARFTVRNFSITFQNQAPLPTEINAIADAAAAKQIGQPSRNEDIVAAYQSVLGALPDHGYPRVKLVRRNVEADHQGAAVTVKVVLDAGPQVAFGKVEFRGLESVREGVVRRQIPWTEGDQFDNREVAKFRQALVTLNLFASIGIDIDEDLEDGTRQPVIVTLAESEHKTVGIGANYSTSKGFGGEVFWEHRNFRGRGEILSVSLKGEEQRQSVQVDFAKPGFLRKDQKLLLGTEVFRDDTDAFREYGGTVDGAVERKLNEHWKVRLGAEITYTDIRDQVLSNDFLLIGAPTTVWYDTSDDLLDPTRGVRLSAEVVPYMSLSGGSGFFTTIDLAGSVYIALDSYKRFVFAARTHMGFLLGEDTANIPASKRFYAGGGTSIRGFAFQSVGPLDAEDDPLGGSSVFEVGAEVRIKLWGPWGIVPFIEGGNVFDTAYPDFSGSLRWGAGLGIRYYTPFGPIRLDVATPLNPRPSDSDFQIYVSIGQSF